jgi:hypothetical protein
MQERKEDVARSEAQTKLEREVGVGGLANPKTGEPILMRNPETAREVAEHKASLDMVNNLIERMKFYRENYGWMSDTVRSAELRRMKQDYAEVLLEKKELAKLGVLAGPDMGLMGDAIGTKDPTEWRGGVTEALEGAQRNARETFTFKVRSQGAAVPEDYTYEPTVPADIEAARNEALTSENFKRDVATFGQTRQQLDKKYREEWLPARPDLVESEESMLEFLREEKANADTLTESVGKQRRIEDLERMHAHGQIPDDQFRAEMRKLR